MSELIVGTVLPFAGQVEPVAGTANRTWTNMPCGPRQAADPGKATDGAVLQVERDGWMLCDGRYLSVAAYPELHAVIGTMYGSRTSAGDVEFAIPDYRGVFLRGFDAGSGLDPDAAGRIAPTGDHVANVVGSLQCDALQTHTHHYKHTQPAALSTEGSAAGTSVTSAPTTAPDEPCRVSEHETRPKNVAVNYIIKFR